MKYRVGVLGLVGCALAACGSDPEAQAARREHQRAAVAEAGAGDEVLAVCGPFLPRVGTSSAIALPAGGKFIAFIERSDETLVVREPFAIPSNPPITQDPTLVAVDAEGRPITAGPTARNAILRRRTITPWSSSFHAGLWRADAQGGPSGNDSETYNVSKSWSGHKAEAVVSINGQASEFTADCS
jgi:hypothetical protein